MHLELTSTILNEFASIPKGVKSLNSTKFGVFEFISIVRIRRRQFFKLQMRNPSTVHCIECDYVKCGEIASKVIKDENPAFLT